jgi:hypothetical protein
MIERRREGFLTLYGKNGCDNDDTVEAYYQGTLIIDYDPHNTQASTTSIRVHMMSASYKKPSN